MHTIKSSILAAIALIAAVTTAPGCMPMADSTASTEWLRHIKPPTVRATPTSARQLIAELQRPELSPNRSYVPAEQIAAYAAHELSWGNEWDAAVLLALASYRYHQQAALVIAKGRGQVSKVNPMMLDKFGEYVITEAKLFNRQNYDSELGMVRSHLFGASVAEQRFQDYLARVADGGERNGELGAQLAEFQAQMSNRAERLAHPELAEAFLARLLDDIKRDSDNTFARYYLAATPLDKFRLAALDAATDPTNGLLANNTAPRLGVLRDAVRLRLSSSNAATRANAAAILGRTPDPQDLPALEQRLATEHDYDVITSLRYALVRHGKLEHRESLLERVRVHALWMIQWLPDEIEAEFDDDQLVQIARSVAYSTDIRAVALIVLRDIAGHRAISPDAVKLALTLTASEDEVLADAATRLVRALEQLSHAECKALYAQYPRAQAPLLNLIAEDATLADLDFLERAYKQTRDDDVELAAALAVAAVEGAASTQLLMRWFANTGPDSESRPWLAALLASRPDVDRAALGKLSLGQRLLAALTLNEPGHPTAIQRGVESIDLQDIAHLAMLPGLLDRPDMAPALWRLASYRDGKSYPADAIVRRLAMGSIIRIQLASRAQKLAQTNAPRTSAR